MKWWEDDKIQMILNTYFPRRWWLIREDQRKERERIHREQA